MTWPIDPLAAIVLVGAAVAILAAIVDIAKRVAARRAWRQTTGAGRIMSVQIFRASPYRRLG